MGCGRLAEEFGFDLGGQSQVTENDEGRNQLFAKEVSEAGWTVEFSLKAEELIRRQLLPLAWWCWTRLASVGQPW